MCVPFLWQTWFAMRFESLHSTFYSTRKTMCQLWCWQTSEQFNIFDQFKMKKSPALKLLHSIQSLAITPDDLRYTINAKKAQKFHLFVLGRKTSGWYYYLLCALLYALCQRNSVRALIVHFLSHSIWIYTYIWQMNFMLIIVLNSGRSDEPSGEHNGINKIARPFLWVHCVLAAIQR